MPGRVSNKPSTKTLVHPWNIHGKNRLVDTLHMDTNKPSLNITRGTIKVPVKVIYGTGCTVQRGKIFLSNLSVLTGRKRKSRENSKR